MNWLDSHCHINDEQFSNDLDTVLDNMVNADVKKAMIVSLDPKEYEYSKTIRHEGIEFKNALGLYPGDVDKYNLEDFIPYYKDVDAIGEIGLDYYWTKENKDKQIKVFIEQCKLARELDKPIIVHSRDASMDTLDILQKYQCRGVLHCYSGSKEVARQLAKFGYYFSFAGPITYKKNEKVREVVESIPIDRILIETDCPYLPPTPYRGQRNEPAYVVETGKLICEILGMNEGLFKMIINDNYDRLFKK